MNKIIAFLFTVAVLPALGQHIIKENRQHSFSNIPAGNYSGICKLDSDRYAVVSDKSATDGFFVFRINIDTVSGDIVDVENLGYRSSGYKNRDMEGIAYLPAAHKVLISGEGDNLIWEYDTTGLRHPVHLVQTPWQQRLTENYGLEALTYNAVTKKIWTCNENWNDTIFLQSYNEDGTPASTYLYHLDPPEAAHPGRLYAHGVSELCALDDGSLLVLEREVQVPKAKLGAWVKCKLYTTDLKKKRLVHSWKTRMNLFDHGLANYEGMCVAEHLSGNRIVLLLVSDSQNQYGGVLKDWFKTLVLQL